MIVSTSRVGSHVDVLICSSTHEKQRLCSKLVLLHFRFGSADPTCHEECFRFGHKKDTATLFGFALSQKLWISPGLHAIHRPRPCHTTWHFVNFLECIKTASFRVSTFSNSDSEHFSTMPLHRSSDRCSLSVVPQNLVLHRPCQFLVSFALVSTGDFVVLVS